MARFLDDRDPQIEYGVDWGFAGGENEYEGTTSMTGSSRSRATLRFTARRVQVFGTISYSGGPTPPTTQFTIDGESAHIFRGTAVGFTQYRTLFYDRDGLSDEVHTLEIQHNSGTLFLDYIVLIEPPADGAVAPDDPPISTTPSGGGPLPIPVRSSSSTLGGATSTRTIPSGDSVPSTQTHTMFVPFGTSDGSSTPSTSTTIPPNGSLPSDSFDSPSSRERIPIGPIIGGALGGLAIICGMIVAVVYILRTKRRPAQGWITNVERRNPSPFEETQYDKGDLYSGWSDGRGGMMGVRSFSPQSWHTDEPEVPDSIADYSNYADDRDTTRASESWATRSLSPPSVASRAVGHAPDKRSLYPFHHPSTLSRLATMTRDGGTVRSSMSSPVDSRPMTCVDVVEESCEVPPPLSAKLDEKNGIAMPPGFPPASSSEPLSSAELDSQFPEDPPPVYRPGRESRYIATQD